MPEPSAQAPAPPSQFVNAGILCEPSKDVLDGLWGCDVVAALDVLDVQALSWSSGRAHVEIKLSNRSPEFLNYPGVSIAASTGQSGTDLRYGMSGCGAETMTVDLDLSAVPPGQPVTLTATAGAIVQGDACRGRIAQRSTTVTAP